jgi:CCR4-NOT transcription complex subunit 10
VRQAALAKLAYVHLCLRDPVAALSAATALLELPRCHEPWRLLGQSYAAEALTLLGRPSEALSHLSPQLLLPPPAQTSLLAPLSLPMDRAAAPAPAGAAPAAVPSSEWGAKGVKPDPAEAARRVLVNVNTGAAHLVARDPDAARHCAAEAMAAHPRSYDARALQLFCLMQSGDAAGARAVIEGVEPAAISTNQCQS